MIVLRHVSYVPVLKDSHLISHDIFGLLKYFGASPNGVFKNVIVSHLHVTSLKHNDTGTLCIYFGVYFI